MRNVVFFRSDRRARAVLIGGGAGALNDPTAVDFDEVESRVGFRATTLANDDNRLGVFNW